MPDGIRQLVQRFTTEFGNARPVGGRPAELAGCWRAGPLEVAYGPDPIPERSLGRVWREHQAGRATPLLVVCPGEADERLVVVGPNNPDPVRRAHALPGVRDRLDAMRREAEGAERWRTRNCCGD